MLSYLPADAAYVVLLQLSRESHLLQHLNVAGLKEKLARVSPARLRTNMMHPLFPSSLPPSLSHQ